MYRVRHLYFALLKVLKQLIIRVSLPPRAQRKPCLIPQNDPSKATNSAKACPSKKGRLCLTSGSQAIIVLSKSALDPMALRPHL